MSGPRRTKGGEVRPGERPPDDAARITARSEAEAAEDAEARLHPAKRLVLGIVGGVLVLVGVVLLVLPGPGLLLVLAGMILLSRAIPAVSRFVEPVREQAMTAAEASVSSLWRVAGSVLAGLGLIAAGIIWGLRLLSWLPFPGWSTGSSLILSGLLLFALLVWSYRRVHGDRTRGEPASSRRPVGTGPRP
jgi:hypothetical protein